MNAIEVPWTYSHGNSWYAVRPMISSKSTAGSSRSIRRRLSSRRGCASRSLKTVSQAQGPADDLLLDLGRPAVDRGDPAVEVGLRDRELHHVAVAPVQLHALVDQLVLGLGRPPLRHRRVDGVELAVQVLAQAVVDVRAG